MNHFKIITLTLFSLLTLNCDKGDIQVDLAYEIRILLDKQVEDWNNKDIEGYMEGYWKSEELTFTSGTTIEYGWQETYDRYKEKYPPELMGKLTFKEIKIKLVSVNAAYVYGIWNLERKDDNPNGRFTLVLRKFVDGWKIIHDHTSSKTE